MSKVKEHWNSIYKTLKEKRPEYDLWLNQYKEILDTSKDKEIIDLGCGSGGDSLYLSERMYKVISCDYSKEALDIVNKYISEVKTMEIDISTKLPFMSESINVIIADLTLHYFNDETTKNIIKEIQRILKNDGYLIGRVNSINDVNYGARSGEEIEKNFYLTEQGYKRFFSKEDIYYYFKTFQIETCKEEKIVRYGAEKKAFEFVVRNCKD